MHKNQCILSNIQNDNNRKVENGEILEFIYHIPQVKIQITTR